MRPPHRAAPQISTATVGCILERAGHLIVPPSGRPARALSVELCAQTWCTSEKLARAERGRSGASGADTTNGETWACPAAATPHDVGRSTPSCTRSRSPHQRFGAVRPVATPTESSARGRWSAQNCSTTDLEHCLGKVECAVAEATGPFAGVPGEPPAAKKCRKRKRQRTKNSRGRSAPTRCRTRCSLRHSCIVRAHKAMWRLL